MKRFYRAAAMTLVLGVCLFGILSYPKKAPAADMDTLSCASINFHEDSSLFAEELIDAINSMDGTYAIATVNPDGTPNIAFVPFGCSFVQDQLYLQMNFTAYSQTHVNLLRTGEAFALFSVQGDVDAESAPVYSMTGARMKLSLVRDPDVAQAINPNGGAGAVFAEITEVWPIG